MHIITALAIIVNIVSIILLSIGLFHNFTKPKNKAIFGYSVAGSILMYMVMLCLVAANGLIVNNNLYSFVLFLCVISLFIIGKLVKYETLKMYTFAQIMCFILSLAVLLLKF